MFKHFAAALMGAVVAVSASAPALAYGHANRYGGSTSATSSGASHTNAYGGHSTATSSGASHSNAYGGSTSANSSGVSHSNAYGGSSGVTTSGSVSHSNMYGGSSGYNVNSGYTSHTTDTGYTTGGQAYHGAYYAPAYAPVPVYSTGCWNCVNGAAVAGAAVVGAAVGASAANANAYNANAAYNSGYAAGASNAAVSSAPPLNYPIGTSVTALPAGCANPTVAGSSYYLCGSTWFKPAYGSNGFYYKVVPAP